MHKDKCRTKAWWAAIATLLVALLAPVSATASDLPRGGPVMAVDSMIDQMAVRLLAGAGGSVRDGIAVLPLPHDDDLCSAFSVAVAELLTDAMVNRSTGGIRVVERRHLQRLIADNQLQSELNDPAAQRRLGGLAAVRLLATGSILPSGQQVRVTVRLIDLSNGTIVASAQGSTAAAPIFDDIRRAVGRGSGCEPLATSGSQLPAAPSRPSAPEERPLAEQERGGMRVSILRAELGARGQQFYVHMAIRNTTTGPLRFHLLAEGVSGQVPGKDALRGSRAHGIPECQRPHAGICTRMVLAGDVEFLTLQGGESLPFSISLPEHRERFRSAVNEISFLSLPFFVGSPTRPGERPTAARRVDFSFGRIILP
ncbi:hypothetical protein STVA_09140 [Allostella vacuolata]|nr:hypothetical protein STVA_09140 [Stella vacuolata]